jgi:DNA-directed RNA polymerase beta subunit
MKKIKCIFNKTRKEHFLNLNKKIPINVQGAHRIQNQLDQKRNFTFHIIIRALSIQDKERILKAAGEKDQTTYKDITIRISLISQWRSKRQKDLGR